MAASHDLHRHMHDDVVASERTEISEQIGVVQIFTAAMGVFFIVIGAIALARTGVGSWTAPRTEVLGLGATPLLALIHIGLGAIGLASAASRPGARSASMFLGAALIAIGIVALVEPVRSLGWDGANGAAYLIIGTLAIASAMVTPLAVYGHRRVVEATEHEHVA